MANKLTPARIAKNKEIAKNKRERAKAKKERIRAKKAEIRAIKKSKKDAIDAWKLAVKTRDNFICQICKLDVSNKPHNCHAHHILDKKNFRMFALDILNGITLCYRCHKVGNKAPHMNALFFANWLQINKPEQYYYLTKKLAELWTIKK